MKHILLQDDEHIFLVYYQPTKKGKLFELLSTETKHYWATQEQQSWGLLFYLVLNVLRPNGFKCEEMLENEMTIDIYRDFKENGDFYYKNILVNIQPNGVGFVDNHNAFCSMGTIGDAIDYIDKEI